MQAIDVSVIISTYNQPKWLENVLWSYNYQTYKNFEVVIADDGSTETTKIMIDNMSKLVNFPIKHIWHADEGFRKTTILNKATLVSVGTYLVFTDGDCIARNDFLQSHINKREVGYCLSGGYFKLPLTISKLITKTDIETQDCFKIDWLKHHGLKKTFKSNKLTSRGFKEYFLNTFTTTKATFDGMNVSGWKANIIEVNGFDERMEYGGEDREIGERLVNLGIKFKQIRYSAICLHLYHERDYVKPEMIEKNKKIRAITKQQKVKQTPFGIKKL